MKKHKKHHEEEHVDETWLIPYADMLTLLLALFIVLFAMSEVDIQKYESLSQIFKSEFSSGKGILEHSSSSVEPPMKAPFKEEDEAKKTEELRQLENLQKDINNYIEKNNLTEVLGTKLTDEGLLITISNETTFDSGSAKVNEEGQKIAREVSKFLYTDPPHQIVVSGHTDNRPIHTSEFPSNWHLSIARAFNFMLLLLNNDNLEKDRFSIKGYGEYKPLVPNTSEKNRAKNRRVEVLILPNYDIKVK
jgi:chemotaxis protein MotB